MVLGVQCPTPYFGTTFFISNKKLLERDVTSYLFTYLRLSIDIHWPESSGSQMVEPRDLSDKYSDEWGHVT